MAEKMQKLMLLFVLELRAFGMLCVCAWALCSRVRIPHAARSNRGVAAEAAMCILFIHQRTRLFCVLTFLKAARSANNTQRYSQLEKSFSFCRGESCMRESPDWLWNIASLIVALLFLGTMPHTRGMRYKKAIFICEINFFFIFGVKNNSFAIGRVSTWPTWNAAH